MTFSREGPRFGGLRGEGFQKWKLETGITIIPPCSPPWPEYLHVVIVSFSVDISLIIFWRLQSCQIQYKLKGYFSFNNADFVKANKDEWMVKKKKNMRLGGVEKWGKHL